MYPTMDVVLSLTASDIEDCIGFDQIFIEVNSAPVQETIVFVPNVFTPNGDQRNDVLFIQAGEGVDLLESFRIFDRWGHLVYEVSLFPPNEQSIGWDGSRKGEEMLPGVYVYQLIYQDGEERIVRKGDITLMR
jgi:gliding motility-associated-like protein